MTRRPIWQLAAFGFSLALVVSAVIVFAALTSVGPAPVTEGRTDGGAFAANPAPSTTSTTAMPAPVGGGRLFAANRGAGAVKPDIVRAREAFADASPAVDELAAIDARLLEVFDSQVTEFADLTCDLSEALTVTSSDLVSATWSNVMQASGDGLFTVSDAIPEWVDAALSWRCPSELGRFVS